MNSLCPTDRVSLKLIRFEDWVIVSMVVVAWAAVIGAISPRLAIAVVATVAATVRAARRGVFVKVRIQRTPLSRGRARQNVFAWSRKYRELKN